MKVRRRRDRITLRLHPAEVAVLGGLLEQLAVLVRAETDDPVSRRLYPAAYPGDEAAEREYRGLTLESLRDDRQRRIAACRDELGAGGETTAEIALDADSGRRWIQVLNDLRLALGTELGITEESEPRLDPADPDHDRRLLYHWLTAVQDELVRALMG